MQSLSLKLWKTSVYVLLVLAVYYPTLRYLVGQWGQEDYSYGYLIPLVVVYLLWERRRQLRSLAGTPSWPGFIVLGMALVLFWIGELGGDYFVLYISFWAVIVGLCWSHLGWEKLKRIGFPLLLIPTMFPPPNFVYGRVSFTLKLISSELGVAMMHLYGMSAYREGNVIDLGFTQLQVVDACSGLRYLIPLFVLGLLLAYFFRAALWKRLLVVFAAVGLSIFTNSVRIALTGILYEVWGAGTAEGFFHGFSGWFIFMFSFGALAGLMWVLKKLPPRESVGTRKGLKGQEGEGEALGLSSRHSPRHPALSTKGGEGERRGVTLAFLRPPQFVVTVLLLASTLALSRGVEFRDRVPVKEALDRFPLRIGEWSGSRESMDQRFIERLDLSDYAIVDYRDETGKAVNFYVAYYETQRKGESIHSPATCLPGSGWRFEDAGEATLGIPGPGEGPMKVNRAIMEKAGLRQLVYYWFLQRGRVLTNAYELKWFVFWDALTKQRTDGALVRVITPVYGDEGLGEAEARLQGFVREVVPVLDGFVPGAEAEAK